MLYFKKGGKTSILGTMKVLEIITRQNIKYQKGNQSSKIIYLKYNILKIIILVFFIVHSKTNYRASSLFQDIKKNIPQKISYFKTVEAVAFCTDNF